MNINTCKINVSDHAIARLKERFYWKFHNYFHHKEMTRNLIYAQVRNANQLHSWKMVPFYVNKLATQYGQGIEILNKSGVYYLCRYNASKDSLHVMTCVKMIMSYK